MTRALPVLVGTDRPAVAARRRARHPARRSAARPAATPGCSTRQAGQVEVAYYADDRVVLHEAAHAWFNGSLLADRWANEAFASYYGLEAAKDLKVKANADALTPRARGGPDPAQRLGRRRSRGHEDRGLRLRGVADPRPGDRRAGRRRRRCRRSGPTRRATSARTSRRCRGAADGRAAGAPETVDGRRTGAACSTSSRPHRQVVRRPVADLGRPRPRTCRCSTHGGPPGRDTTAVVAEAGDWQLPRPVRDAMRAWQFDEATALLRRRAAVLDQRASIAAAAAVRADRRRRRCGRRSRRPDGFAGGDAGSDRRDRPRSTATTPRSRHGPRPRTCSRRSGLWDATPEASLGQARDAFAAGDLARVRGRGRGGVGRLGVAPRSWVGAGRSASVPARWRSCSRS